VERVNQVWSTDITYIRMAQGFVYLVAVMDWFSRFVLSWSLSLTLEVEFCVEALKRALRRGRPDIFNSDQGSQFTSEKFTGSWRAPDRDQHGREGPLHGTTSSSSVVALAEYEEVYLKDYASVTEARAASPATFGSTTTSACTRASITGRRRRSTWHGGNRDDRTNFKEGSVARLGDSVPEPLGFIAFAPECLFYNEGT